MVKYVYINDVFHSTQYIQKIISTCNQYNIKILYSYFYAKSSKSSGYFVFKALTTFQELSRQSHVTNACCIVQWSLAVFLDVVKERQKIRNRISSAGRVLVPCWWLLRTLLMCQVFIAGLWWILDKWVPNGYTVNKWVLIL